MTDSVNVWEPKNPITPITNNSSVVTEYFTASEGQTVFNVSSFLYVPGTSSILVFRDGELQIPLSDVIETSQSKFTLTSPCALNAKIVVVGFIGYLQALVDPYYLGPKAAAPTEDNQGITLGTAHEGFHYWDTTSNSRWFWTGLIWQAAETSVATSANLVSVADAGAKFTGSDAETVLQECAVEADLASVATAKGASLVGSEDAGGYFTGTTAEAILQELGAATNISQGSWTPTLQDTTLSDAEGQTYATQSGRYLKLGNICFVTCELAISSIGTLTAGATAVISFDSLPFTPANYLPAGAMLISYARGLAITAGTSITGSFIPLLKYITLETWNTTTGSSATTVAQISATGNIRFSGFFFV